ncbi:MAG: carboxylating nicotinate-nucleotide diphosphorylase [Candidatus Hodarchaeota archaeon]
MSYLPSKLLEKRLIQFLQEDMEYGDITSNLIPNIQVQANVISKEEGILCGLDFTKILLRFLDIEVSSLFNDGDVIRKGDIIMQLRGLSRDILVSERTILNLLMRLSGIATQTRKLVDRVKNLGHDIIIASTRKTTPGFRYFEKYAVNIGGGDPHRWSLSDTVLIKENHLSLLRKGAILKILNKTKNMTSFTKKVDIEVENLSELKEALKLTPDIIMLDNFSIEDIYSAIEIVRNASKQPYPLIEVSGGISDQNIEKYLIAGIDIISMGNLTHSVKSIDFSLKIIKPMSSFSSGETHSVE